MECFGKNKVVRTTFPILMLFISNLALLLLFSSEQKAQAQQTTTSHVTNTSSITGSRYGTLAATVTATSIVSSTEECGDIQYNERPHLSLEDEKAAIVAMNDLLELQTSDKQIENHFKIYNIWGTSEWAVGELALVSQRGAIVPSSGDIVIAWRNPDRQWVASSKGTTSFNERLKMIPDMYLAASTKEVLFAPVGNKEPLAASAGIYRLPYSCGVSADVTHVHSDAGQVYDIDFVIAGSNIVAARDGWIEQIVESHYECCYSSVCEPCNNYIVIDHGDGEYSYYLHIKQWSVPDNLSVGTFVHQGDKIAEQSDVGWSGGSGRDDVPCNGSTVDSRCGVHLHFGVHKGPYWNSSTVQPRFQDIYDQHGTWYVSNGQSYQSGNCGGGACCGCGTTRQSDIQPPSLANALAIGPSAPFTNPSNQSAKHFQRIRLTESQDKTSIPNAPGVFNKDQVLCDNDLLDVNSMSEADIQDLLNQRNSFFKDYYDPQTGLLASHIIYTQAQNNHISPQLILAKMQAESSSIWSWRDMSQLIDPDRPELGTKADWVLFYGWPDSAPPNPAYKGFYNQVHNAAQSLRAWYDDPDSMGWAIGVPHAVSDGTVTPVNATTIALYVYTPWISSNDLLWQVWWMMWGDTGCSDSDSCCGCGTQRACSSPNDTLASAIDHDPLSSSVTSTPLPTALPNVIIPTNIPIEEATQGYPESFVQKPSDTISLTTPTEPQLKSIHTDEPLGEEFEDKDFSKEFEATNQSRMHTAPKSGYAPIQANIARPASSNYYLARSVMAMGGGVKTSASYRVLGTSGQTNGVSQLASVNYTVNSGFWPGAMSMLGSFDIYLPLVLSSG